MEELRKKIDAFNFSKEERIKAETKFTPAISVINYEELVEILEYLRSMNIHITKAKDMKVAANSLADLRQKNNIMSEIHEESMFVQDPSRLLKNALDVHGRIQKCKQLGKAYKKADGSYESFLFKTADFQKEYNKTTELENGEEKNYLDDIQISNEPSMGLAEIKFEEPIEEEISIAEFKPVEEEIEHIDIQEYMKNVSDDLEDMEAKTTDFASVRRQLEDELDKLRDLDELSKMNFEDEISFGDIEPETYGMGRAA